MYARSPGGRIRRRTYIEDAYDIRVGPRGVGLEDPHIGLAWINQVPVVPTLGTYRPPVTVETNPTTVSTSTTPSIVPIVTHAETRLDAV